MEHNDKSRLERGLAKLREIHGAKGEDAVLPLGDLGRYIAEFGFADIYCRPGLSLRDRQMLTLGMLAVLGGREAPLKVHINSTLNLGVTAQEIEEIFIQSALYGGFPVAMAAMNLLKQVLEERGASE